MTGRAAPSGPAGVEPASPSASLAGRLCGGSIASLTSPPPTAARPVPAGPVAPPRRKVVTLAAVVVVAVVAAGWYFASGGLVGTPKAGLGRYLDAVRRVQADRDAGATYDTLAARLADARAAGERVERVQRDRGYREANDALGQAVSAYETAIDRGRQSVGGSASKLLADVLKRTSDEAFADAKTHLAAAEKAFANAK
ncbi:MAG: hypothetical protein JWO31_3262 [Phycisphaerales bacterium]|nr:hypothetical protein [Phycisphaerales bacterium]